MPIALRFASLPMIPKPAEEWPEGKIYLKIVPCLSSVTNSLILDWRGWATQTSRQCSKSNSDELPLYESYTSLLRSWRSNSFQNLLVNIKTGLPFFSEIWNWSNVILGKSVGRSSIISETTNTSQLRYPVMWAKLQTSYERNFLISLRTKNLWCFLSYFLIVSL